MARHSRPEVAAGAAVERSSVTVKITGNMIELNSPIDSARYAAVDAMRAAMTARHSSAATAAKTASSHGARCFTRNSRPLPMKRPTIAPPQ